MKVKIIAMFIVASAFALASCSKKKLNGQVFVVTKGRENVEIGLAPVYLVPDPAFRELAAEVAGEIETQIRSEAQRTADSEAVSELQQQLAAMENGNLKIPGLSNLFAHVAHRRGQLHPGKPQTHSEFFAKVRDEMVRRAEASVQDSPEAVAKTDAEGRFRVGVVGDGWLISSAERQVGDSEESYLWIVPLKASEIKSDSPLLISNDSNFASLEALYELLAEASGQVTKLDWFEEAKVSSELANVIEKAKTDAEEAKRRAEEQLAREMQEAAEAKAKEEREAKAKNEREVAELGESIGSGELGSTIPVKLPGGNILEMAWIPPGTFPMGSPPDEESRSDTENQIRVTISRGFWLGKTEVTQAQWKELMGSNPSEFQGDDLPVENVSWNDAMEFIDKLNRSGILPAGWKFTLPTEAQWEYACRAGVPGPYAGRLDEMGWYSENSGSRSHPVGQKKPNRAGLYDMHGNVYEWCLDSFDMKKEMVVGIEFKTLPPLKGGTDPLGTVGSGRMLRGGGWKSDAEDCRSADRDWGDPDARNSILGFRVAVSSTP